MSAVNLSRKLISHFSYLDQTRKKGIVLLENQQIVRRDIEFIYKGLFFDVATSFENFLEELFLGLLSERLVHSNRKFGLNLEFRRRYMITSRSGIQSRDSFEKAFLMKMSGRKYLDWMPYEFTIEKSQLCFKDGFPFCELDRDDRDYLKKFHLLRNVLAHDSDASRRAFLNEVVRDLPLTSKEKQPVGYLLSRVAGYTRLEEIIHRLSRISRKLVS